MKKVLFAVLSVFLCVNAFAQEQDQKTPTPEEMAAKEADRLGDLLRLADIPRGFHSPERFRRASGGDGEDAEVPCGQL